MVFVWYLIGFMNEVDVLNMMVMSSILGGRLRCLVRWSVMGVSRMVVVLFDMILVSMLVIL